MIASYRWPNGNASIFLDEPDNLCIGTPISLLVGDLKLFNQLDEGRHKKLNDFLEDNSFTHFLIKSSSSTHFNDISVRTVSAYFPSHLSPYYD